MLFANHFFAGSLDMATVPSLILPRSNYEEPFLIGLTGSGPTAVFLDGQNRFRSMSAAGNKDWHGVIVPQIRVAVCAKHIVDPNHAKEPGMMVRIGTKLAICTRDARLLSFAQFEREVTAERIRDKIAASKRKGLWMGGNVPIGYRACGRTLAIDETEAKLVRRLYDLYRAEGSILAVRDRAAELGLRTRVRTTLDGRVSGGGPFERAHLHHILTNPVYAGRIRHRSVIHDGQHPPLIPPTDWDEVQALLKAGAARPRGRKPAAFAAPLAGKIFDETGDRLTPSHSRKNGHRLRYYVSNRLVNDRSRNHPEAWRLPAPELEQGIAGRIRAWATSPGQAARILVDPALPEIDPVGKGLDDLAHDLSGAQAAATLRALVADVRIAPGHMVITLAPESLAERLGVAADRLQADQLGLEAPFRIRRKGVEAKVVLGERAPDLDRVLIRNLMKARDWFAALAHGETYAEIAERDGVSNQRIQQMLPLAFLAPDIIQLIAEGRQPISLTTEWLLSADLPIDWDEQRALIVRL